MARRSFFERLEDRLLEFGSKTLKAATDALDVVTQPVESPSARTPQPTTPVSSPRSGGGSRLTRTGRLEDLVEQLLEANRLQSAELERQQAQLASQQREIEQLRRQTQRETDAETRQRRAIERAEAKLTTYPRRVRGRLGRLDWTEINRRMTRPNQADLDIKFDELLRVGVPESLMAIVQVKQDLYDLYVKDKS